MKPRLLRLESLEPRHLKSAVQTVGGLSLTPDTEPTRDGGSAWDVQVRTQDYELTAGSMTAHLLDYARCYAVRRVGAQPKTQRELPSGYVDYYDLIHLLRAGEL
jgi:hypothetical protein